MAWLRIDDRVRTHPKIAQAGPAAAWLWFCSICYCREHLTDGRIPKSAVTSLAMNLPSPWKHAARLVEVRLWEDDVGGYLVHDFLDWNPTRAEVLSLRDKERDKKRTQRGTDEGHERDASHAGAGGRPRDRAGDAGLGSPSVALGVPGLVEESARGTMLSDVPEAVSSEPIAWRKAGNHGVHAWCGRVCVTLGLHADLKQRLGGDDAHAHRRLMAWYPQAIARYDGQPMGDDLFDFWRNEFSAWVGTVSTPRAPQKADKAAQSMSAADRVIARQLAQRKAMTP